MARSAADLAQEVTMMRENALQRLQQLADAKAQKRAQEEAIAKAEYEREQRARQRRENEDVKSSWGALGVGAGSGAAIGSLFGPGIGTGIGALVGGLSGLALGTGAEVANRKALDKVRGKKTKSTWDYIGKSLGRAPTLNEGLNLLGGAGQVAGSYKSAQDNLAAAKKTAGQEKLYSMAYTDMMNRQADALQGTLTQNQAMSGYGQTYNPVTGRWEYGYGYDPSLQLIDG